MENKNFESELIPDLEQIMSEYVDLKTYRELMEINPNLYTEEKYNYLQNLYEKELADSIYLELLEKKEEIFQLEENLKARLTIIQEKFKYIKIYENKYSNFEEKFKKILDEKINKKSDLLKEKRKITEELKELENVNLVEEFLVKILDAMNTLNILEIDSNNKIEIDSRGNISFSGILLRKLKYLESIPENSYVKFYKDFNELELIIFYRDISDEGHMYGIRDEDLISPLWMLMTKLWN